MKTDAQPLAAVKNPLSIVIIARNEARRIGQCIESGIAAAALLPGTEIVLVDSASTDATIEIARHFPISIIQLQPNWPLTPGAGRYLGTRATCSDYILFVDGDTEIYGETLVQALEFLRRHEEVAGVGGTREEFYVDEGGQLTGEVHPRYKVREATQVPALGGDGLYRRSALERAGTFHPYLAWHEEAELALRLRKAGYTLWRLPLALTRHYSLPRGTFQEAIRRFRVGFYPRAGRTLRATYKNGLAGQFVREFLMPYAMTAGYLLAGIGSIIAALFDRRWLMAWLSSGVAIFTAYSVRKRSARRAFDSLVARLMVVYGLVRGFLETGHDPDQYPSDAVVLQIHNHGIGPPAHLSAKPASGAGAQGDRVAQGGCER